jgi:hypothetical protein
MDIDKNDVDLTKLFKWNKGVEIRDENNEVVKTVYMRLVGDAELNRARVFALRESSNLRRLLKTEGSEEREAFIADLDIRGPDFLAKAITILSMNTIANEARRSVVLDLPREPDSDASLEEQERYQQLVDDFPNKYVENVEEKMSELSQRLESDMLALPLEELEKAYEEAIIGNMCSTKMTSRFQDMCVFLGTFADKEMKNRLFSSFEEFDNLATEIKDQLIFQYNTLDMPVENLKK